MAQDSSPIPNKGFPHHLLFSLLKSQRQKTSTRQEKNSAQEELRWATRTRWICNHSRILPYKTQESFQWQVTWNTRKMCHVLLGAGTNNLRLSPVTLWESLIKWFAISRNLVALAGRSSSILFHCLCLEVTLPSPHTTPRHPLPPIPCSLSNAS